MREAQQLVLGYLGISNENWIILCNFALNAYLSTNRDAVLNSGNKRGLLRLKRMIFFIELTKYEADVFALRMS